MKKIPHDKVLHALSGQAAATVGTVAGSLSGGGPELQMALASGAAVVIALLREAYNVTQGKPWSWADVAATLAGAAPVVLVIGLPR